MNFYKVNISWNSVEIIVENTLSQNHIKIKTFIWLKTLRRHLVTEKDAWIIALVWCL